MAKSAELKCRDCGNIFTTPEKTPDGEVCPNCGSSSWDGLAFVDEEIWGEEEET